MKLLPNFLFTVLICGLTTAAPKLKPPKEEQLKKDDLVGWLLTKRFEDKPWLELDELEKSIPENKLEEWAVSLAKEFAVRYRNKCPNKEWISTYETENYPTPYTRGDLGYHVYLLMNLVVKEKNVMRKEDDYYPNK